MKFSSSNLKYSIENIFEDAESGILKLISSNDRETLKLSILSAINSSNPKHSFKELSPRENEIAQLITQGKRQKEIAVELNISVETVKTHAKKIRKKLSSIKT